MTISGVLKSEKTIYVPFEPLSYRTFLRNIKMNKGRKDENVIYKNMWRIPSNMGWQIFRGNEKPGDIMGIINSNSDYSSVVPQVDP